MANLAKLEFAALDISRNNYLSWVLDAKIHPQANSLGKTIMDGSDAFPEENAKTMIFLCCHIHEVLKSYIRELESYIRERKLYQCNTTRANIIPPFNLWVIHHLQQHECTHIRWS
ncbi:hypothetical protein ACE6H2_015757 [Prunus campanulata]